MHHELKIGATLLIIVFIGACSGLQVKQDYDLSDAETRRFFWRGIGERRLSQQSTPEKTTEMVNRTVAEILAQYPPGLGK